MCAPAMALQIGSIALSALAAAKQSDAQIDAANETAEIQAQERGDAAQLETSQRQAEAMRERGRLLVSAAESGIALNSNSFEESLAGSFASENRDLLTIKKNAASAGRAASSRLNEAVSGTKSRWGILTDAAVQGSSVYTKHEAAGLQIKTD